MTMNTKVNPDEIRHNRLDYPVSPVRYKTIAEQSGRVFCKKTGKRFVFFSNNSAILILSRYRCSALNASFVSAGLENAKKGLHLCTLF